MRTICVEKNLPKMLAVKLLRPYWPGVIWSPLSPARFATLRDPPLPSPRGVRARNRVCGLCNSDLSLLMVKADPAIGPAALPGTSIFYLGHEVVSELLEVGPEVQGLRAGQRVLLEHGTNASSCAALELDPPCPLCLAGMPNLCQKAGPPLGVGGGWGDGFTAHASDLFPVPDDLTDDQAAMVEPMSVAVHSVLRQPPRDGQHLLVIGSGIIGLFTLQAARAVAPEAHLTALARHAHQAEAARASGADEVVFPPDLYSAMARITGAQLYRAPFNRGMLLGGFDRVYDCVGSAETITDALRWTRARGAVVLVGIELSRLRVDLNPIWHQEVDLLGSNSHASSEWQGRRQNDFQWVIDWVRAGKLRIDGLITHRFPLERYREAIHAATHKRQSRAIKVVFDLRAPPLS